MVVAEAQEDEWAEFGPAFGSTLEDETSDPVATDTPDPVVEPDRESGGFGLGGTLLASGGALVAGGLVVNFAIVNPTYASIQAANDDPYSITRDDASALTSQFNTYRYLTIGLTAGGLALVGTSVFIDAPIRPVIGPRHLGIAGRF